MKRSSLAALAALTALPAAVIVSTAISTSGPAEPATAATLARLTDTGNSGSPPATVTMGGCADGEVQTTVSWNPQPGQSYSFTINSPGSGGVTVTPKDPSTKSMELGLQPSTNYTLTVAINGTNSAPIPMTTPSC